MSIARDKNYTEDLHCLQEELQKLDSQLAGIFEQRMKISEKIARARIESGARVLDLQAEKKQTEQLVSMTDDEYARRRIEDLYSQILSMSRKRQYQLLAEYGAAGRLPFIAVDELEKEHVRVVYQGVEGAYSHAAMNRFFGDTVNSFHVKKWREAMEAIADGAADYAVLPIENSSAGIVADNFDLLVDFENYIVAEQEIPIEHVLMGLPGTKLSDIDTVISHQQALSQCEQFLDLHDNWQRVPWENTAVAARKVAEEGIRSHAAIGSAFAAKQFGLEILEDHIFYNQANSTRFIIVTNQRIFRKDAGKISICFEVPHQSGTLYTILSHFFYNNVNMNRIESRPTRGRNWEYRFFVDFDGNLSQSSVKNALRGIRAEAINLKILGNY